MKEKTIPTKNPIDSDKIAEAPGLLKYPHHVGGVPIKINDEAVQRSVALNAMDFQTDQQLLQIKSQMELLASQVKEIQDRKRVSEWIYNAKIRFKPEINHVYHLYRNSMNEYILSLISPEEFMHSQRNLGDFVNTVRLLGDHTWHIVK
ncbi:MAG: Uncharacterised protein [Owenweeksia sp. TMED14]|nr:MAG: Uncharacterised protein [Owenweeksia sp. TMED14]|tara:strand:- start:3407 stop:3850 length:444 start_codon:yes stop_codon:yes gene_type:complete